MNLRNLAIWGVIVALLLALYGFFRPDARSGMSPRELTYSELLTHIDSGRVKRWGQEARRRGSSKKR